MIVSDHSNKLIEQTSFTKVNVIKSNDLSWFKPNIDKKALKEAVSYAAKVCKVNGPRL